MPDWTLENPDDAIELDVDGNGVARRYRVDLREQEYRAKDLVYFGDKLVQGDYDYKSFTPDSVWARNDWSGGDGRVRFEQAFPRRCKQTTADIRFRRQATKRLALQLATVPQSASVVGFVRFEGNDYAAAGRYVYRSTDGGITWTEVNDRGSGTVATHISVTSDYAGTDGPVLLIAYGDGTAYTYSNNGSAFTNSSRAGDDAFATRFVNLQNRVWRLFQASDGEVTTVSNTTDPDNAGAGWGGTVKLANSDAPANNLLSFDNAILIGKTDGLHSVETDGTTRHLADFGSLSDPVTCNMMTVHENQAWFNQEDRIFAYNGQITVNQSTLRAFESLGPEMADWSDGEVDGEPIDGISAGGFLWVVVRSNSGNYLVRCFNSTGQFEAGARGAGWSTFVNLGTTEITSIGWSSNDGSNPTLLVGTLTNIRYIIMPDRTLNPFADQSGNIRYVTADDDLEFETYDAEMPDVAKQFIQAEIEVDNSSATAVQVLYTIDGGSQQSLGSTTSDGAQTFRFPTNEDGSGRRIDIIVRLSTTNSAQTPAMFNFVLRFELRPARRMEWILPLMLSEDANIDQFHGHSVQGLYENILEARDRDFAVHFKDLRGETFTVFVKEIIRHVARHERRNDPGSEGSYEELIVVRIKQDAPSLGVCYADAEGVFADQQCYAA
jgi:hypothetical protein